MLKSKIFIKAMLIVSGIIIIFAGTLSFIIVPKIEITIKGLEERNAKKTLYEVVNKINSVHKNLEKFKKHSTNQHKKELKGLTDTVWSIIQNKYNQSKMENIGELLKKRALEFENNLEDFYYQNKNKLPDEELKKAIIKFIEVYRYNEGDGYFWANEYESSKMVIHPISPALNGTFMNTHMNFDGTIIYEKIIESLANKKHPGVLTYKWLNPVEGSIEEKVSYVFKFKPYNWVIGTGEYVSVLKKRLQKEVFELISKINYDNGNYFFIMDYNNMILSHPYLEGQDFSQRKDIKGNLIVPSMIKIAKEKGEGFYTFWWQKNKDDKETYKKISFIKDFPDWKIVIGTGVYVDEIENEIEKRKQELITELKEIIKTTKLAKTGYLYIMAKSGKMIVHPNSDWEGKDVRKTVKNPVTDTYMYDDLIKAYDSRDKQFYYTLNRPDDKKNFIYEKVAWIEYIPEFEWYVASSIYTKELKESVIEVKEYIFILTSLALIFALFISFIFLRKLLNPLNTLSSLVLKVSRGDFTTRYPEGKKDDEISILAHKFNEMVETIESRTNDLEESNDELEHMIHNLKRTQNKLIESEKMASLGKLVAGVAHEVNTPVGIGLTASSHLSFITQELDEKYQKEEMSQKAFESYLKEADKLATLIFTNLNRTSDIIKNFKQVAVDQTSEQKRVFYLKEYTEGIIISIDNIIRKKDINVDIKCDDSISISSYPGLYSQIMTNLVINSIRHGFKGRDNGNITIDIKIEDNKLNIVYMDNGIGISEENLPQIFDPFFTTNREDGGSGLGLNIIYNIITNNLKGTISCNSKINEGVIFRIELPFDIKGIKGA